MEKSEEKKFSENLRDEKFTIGYARVSSRKQNLDMQIEDLRKAGCQYIVSEKQSSMKRRPAQEEMLENLQPGDTLVVWSLTRLARSLRELLQVIEELSERGVRFRSLKEDIDTGGVSGKLILRIFMCIAEYEREMIQERTAAGREAARRNGRSLGGRKKKLNDKQIKAAKTMINEQNMTVTEVAKTFKVATCTMYAALGKNFRDTGECESLPLLSFLQKTTEKQENKAV